MKFLPLFSRARPCLLLAGGQDGPQTQSVLDALYPEFSIQVGVCRITRWERGIEAIIFASRWLQTPLYLGMVVVQFVYAYKFLQELVHLITHAHSLCEVDFMQVVLSLSDILMIANLIVMVVIGGYVTFVSMMDLQKHENRPRWLEHIDPGALKIKLAGALVGISGVNLLKTFGQLGSQGLVLSDAHVMMQAGIHLVFVLSTVLLAWGELIMAKKYGHKRDRRIPWMPLPTFQR